MEWIDFNKPSIVGKEIDYIRDAIISKKALCGNGHYTRKCTDLLEKELGIPRVLLTTSCTSALEMCAMLLNITKGDEVILPSYTFVSTANAFVIRGAKPVFIDIRPDTLNIDENLIEKQITKKTRAIVVVHYAGVSAEMEKILTIANKYKIPVIEDAAQAIDARYRGKSLGTLGDLGAFSFHETKNCVSGEGGALLINKSKYIKRAEIILEKGTNRAQFIEGKVQKYSWVDIGSSYVLSELNSSFLFAQLEKKKLILKQRMTLFQNYFKGLKVLEDSGYVELPGIPEHCKPNGHMFYLICKSAEVRIKLMKFLRKNNIEAVFHYIPLHNSPMGLKVSNKNNLPVTERISRTIIRLPLFYGLSASKQKYIIRKIRNYFPAMYS